jgi:taurine dioxygenase
MTSSQVATTFQVDDLTPNIGSVVTGIDCSSELDEGTVAALRNLWLERQVLFFRDQKLDVESQVRFARVFGVPQEVAAFFPKHPESSMMEVLETKGKSTGTDVWHADLTWQQTPPRGTCLYAVDVPPVGGDTMWSSMTTAYKSLSPELQQYLGRLTALHNWETTSVTDHIRGLENGQERYEQTRRDHTPIEQPIVRPHPETGEPVLFVNSLYTTRIVGVSKAESDHLLAYLTGLANVAEWQVRFRWQVGSMAIWDNHAVQHYAVNDYYPSPRLMHRVTIK